MLSKILCYLNWPEIIADISRVPREITSEKRAQKFYTDDASLVRSVWKILRSFFTRHFEGKHATGGVAKNPLFFIIIL